MNKLLKILVVDDHPLLREGVVSTLDSAPDMVVAAEGENYDDAVILSRTLKPGAVLLDLRMPGGGMNAVRDIHLEFPSIKLIVLTASEEESDVMSSLRMGANAYILKGVAGSELTDIVRNVVGGETYVTPHLATHLLLDSSDSAVTVMHEGETYTFDLHKRERQILIALQDGLSNKEIADSLSLSEKTIKHYMTKILYKLRVKNRVEAALLAQKNNIV